MRTKSPKFCHIDLDESTAKLSVWIYGGPTKAVRQDCGSKVISMEELEEACREYWKVVDDGVEGGILTEEDPLKTRAFYDRMKTFGAKLAALLFSEETRRKVWRHTKGTDILVLFTDLLWVPWEALYSPDYDSFLSDGCVITRCPKSEGEREEKDHEEAPIERARLVCIDPCLNSITLSCGSRIADVLQADGESIYITSIIDDLKEEVRGARVIHWICEHADEGLRLDEGVFYSIDDCAAHHFPVTSTLFMISCRSGRGHNGTPGIGARIAERSQCTVIAPSSLVAVQAGVDFLRRINRWLSRGGMTKLSEVWVAMRQGEKGSDRRTVTADMCYALWFGIYGDCEVKLV